MSCRACQKRVSQLAPGNLPPKQDRPAAGLRLLSMNDVLT